MSKSPSGLTRLERLKEAVRGYLMGPIMSSDPRARDFFGGSPTSTGVSVDEFSAMNYSAVYAAVQLISSQVGNLPLVLYKKERGGGKTRYEAHPLYRLVHDRPNPEMSSLVWRESLQAHVLTWGNLYSEIQRNGEGRPVALWPITPDRVTPFRRGSDTPLEYRVVNRDGADEYITAANMIHVPGLGFNGVCGYSVIAKMRESIGLGLAAEKFGGAMYGNGLTIGGVLSFQGPKPPEISDGNYLSQLKSRHQGVDRAHGLLALYNGAKYERMNIEPNDAQFLETRQFQVDEIARWFNLPPHKLKELMRSTNNNIEHQNLEYYIDCLSPWLERWEQELCEKLIAPSERNLQEIEFVVDGLLRGDVASRGEFHSKQFNIGGLTPNDVRSIENRNPLAGGDDAFVALNLIPLKLAVPYYEALIDSTKAKAEADRRPPPEPVAPASATPDPEKAREIALLTEARDTARRCAQEAEDAKDVIAADLATVRADLAHTISERDTIAAARAAEAVKHQQRIESLSLDVTVALRDWQAADARAEEERLARIESLTGTTQLRADLDRATADLTASVERCALIEADYQRVCQEMTNLRAVCDEAVARAELAGVSIADAHQALHRSVETARQTTLDREQERAIAIERIAALEADGQRLMEARTQADAANQATVTELRGQIVTVTQELTTTATALSETQTRLETSERTREVERAASVADVTQANEARTQADAVNAATVTELRSQITAVTQELAGTTTALLEARTVIGTLEGTRDSQRELLTAAEQELASRHEAVQTMQARLAETQVAIRGTLVDAVNRLLAKETERARKAQASPAKLGAWVETFYPIHEDFCRVALKPAVRAMLVAHGSDEPVDRVLDRIVLAHVSESSRQLQGVIQDSDIESLAPALERVLRRWEAERADALADRILKEAA